MKKSYSYPFPPLNFKDVLGFLVLGVLLLSYSEVFSQRVVVIGLDGLSVEGFKQSKHPHIDQLFSNGVISLTTRPVMPSITLPNWTSHFTGSGPEEHGVTTNTWTLAKHDLSAIEADEDGYYPSIFSVLKKQNSKVKTAFYYNWAELIYPINKKVIDELSFEKEDGYLENYKKAVDFLLENRKDPSLVFLYSVHTDHAGHKFKWMSPQYINAVEDADRAIGKFVDSLKTHDLYKDTYFMLITDHGGIGNGHGGTTLSEMEIPWAVVGPKINKVPAASSFFYNSNRNTSYVIAKIFGVKSLPKSWAGNVPDQIFR